MKQRVTCSYCQYQFLVELFEFRASYGWVACQRCNRVFLAQENLMYDKSMAKFSIPQMLEALTEHISDDGVKSKTEQPPVKEALPATPLVSSPAPLQLPLPSSEVAKPRLSSPEIPVAIQTLAKSLSTFDAVAKDKQREDGFVIFNSNSTKNLALKPVWKTAGKTPFVEATKNEGESDIDKLTMGANVNRANNNYVQITGNSIAGANPTDTNGIDAIAYALKNADADIYPVIGFKNAQNSTKEQATYPSLTAYAWDNRNLDMQLAAENLQNTNAGADIRANELMSSTATESARQTSKIVDFAMQERNSAVDTTVGETVPKNESRFVLQQETGEQVKKKHSIVTSNKKQGASSHLWGQNAPWIGCILMGVLLIFQVLLHERNFFAAQGREMNQAIKSMCAVVGCNVDAYRDIDSIVLEQNTLNREENLFQLSFQIYNKNHWVSVKVPDLQVELQDLASNPVIRKTISQEELKIKETGLAPLELRENQLQFQISLPPDELKRVRAYKVLAFYP